MTHLRMMDLRINGFWKRCVWVLKEGVEVGIFLFLATESTEYSEIS